MHRSSGSGRDHRIDVLRGICLAMIFINHVPGNHFEAWTSRNFGFSDAAEAFVLISGISVGLAYSGGFRSGKLRDGVVKVWRRARTLYGVHIAITLLAGALFAASLTVLDVEKLATGLNVDPLLQEPLAALAAVAGLVHQLGYFDILPLYIALLLAAPLYIVIGMHRPWTMLAGAAALWLAAGLFRLNLPLLYADHGWQFNPFAWQLLFAFGLAGGIAARQGRKFVAYRPWLFALASAWLAFCFFWAATRQGPLPGADMLPGFLYGYDKPYLALPRLLHVLALAYVLTNIGAVGRLLAMKAFRPADLMGRQSLAVFAAGSLLAVFVQIVRFGEPANLVGDALLISGGLLMQYSLARFMAERKAGAQRTRDHARAGRNVTPAEAPAA
ncbi:OpgC family protein [Mesorhizobium xinjiangense]|uniref:OpgC family protein n=1 Tax=Mesorhizobium xinjiangense TaxID=2678685 RepID=UPI0012ED7543|nr:OpgC domain-containing protein [Mesorhizobium xinjiangense]